MDDFPEVLSLSSSDGDEDYLMVGRAVTASKRNDSSKGAKTVTFSQISLSTNDARFQRASERADSSERFRRISAAEANWWKVPAPPSKKFHYHKYHVQANRFIDSSYHSLKAKRSKTKTTEKQLEHKTEYLDSSSDDSVDEMQSMPSPRTPPQNRRSRKRVKTPNAPVKVKKTVAEAPTREAGTREATTKDLFRTIPLGFLTFAVAYGPHLCSLNANIFDAWSTELWQLWSNLDSTKRAMFEKSESQSTKKEP